MDRLYYPYKLFRSFRVVIKHTLSDDVVSHKYYTWIRSVFTVAMTRKSNKSRMGKGKGKLLYYMGVLSSGCFFAEILGPALYQMREFLRRLGGKLPVRTSIIICNFTHSLGFSKFSFYKFENVMGVRVNYMYRLRHIHKLLVTTRRLVNYAPLVLRDALWQNQSPFGVSIGVRGYGRCLTLHQKYSSNNAVRHNYRKFIYKYRHRRYYRHKMASFFYFFMNRRTFIDYEDFGTLKGIMLRNNKVDACYTGQRLLNSQFDYLRIHRFKELEVPIISRQEMFTFRNVNYAYII